MAALRRDAEASGTRIVLNTPALAAKVTTHGIELEVGGAEPTSVRCKNLVNAAGLSAQRFAASIAGLAPSMVPACHYAKGHYFVLAGRAPFSHLVYPVPEPGGLGVHVTLDLAGQARFGPDVSWLSDIDYAFVEERVERFYPAIRRYFPGLRDGSLLPGYTGIRPKLAGEGTAAQDFVIQGPADHGVPGLVNLFGIESPGLTAALPLAAEVRARLSA
jgi:L-2-hydroxyglutarate oxidase LhgO